MHINETGEKKRVKTKRDAIHLRDCLTREKTRESKRKWRRVACANRQPRIVSSPVVTSVSAANAQRWTSFIRESRFRRHKEGNLPSWNRFQGGSQKRRTRRKKKMIPTGSFIRGIECKRLALNKSVGNGVETMCAKQPSASIQQRVRLRYKEKN